MLRRAAKAIRTFADRFWRAGRSADQYPILLPHATVMPHFVATVDGRMRPIVPAVSRALSLCDGSRKVSEIVSQASIRPIKLIEAEDWGGTVLHWDQPLQELVPEPAAATSILISPHFDDAALSLGGWCMARSSAPRLSGCIPTSSIERPVVPSSERTLVIDVFSQVCWWRLDARPESRDLVQATRAAEEALVMRLMRTAYRTLDLPEAPLRGYAMDELFTAAVRPEDAATQEIIQAAVVGLKRAHPAADWILPLGIGGHVDHRLARDATLAGLSAAGHDAPIWFYEDLPYAALTKGVADYSRYLPDRVLKLRLMDGFLEKTAVLQAYWSQLLPKQVRLVDAYAWRFGTLQVERLWVLE